MHAGCPTSYRIVIGSNQARSGGGAVPLWPPRHAPLRPPLEPEAGSNIFNSKLAYYGLNNIHH